MRGPVYRQLVGEFVATFAFLYTAMATWAGQQQLLPGGQPYLACILASLFMVVAIVPAFHATGLPHANPCLSLVACMAGFMPVWLLPGYLLVQALATALAALCACLTVPPYQLKSMTALTVQPPVPLAALFLGEFLVSFIFMFVVVAVGFYSPRPMKLENASPAHHEQPGLDAAGMAGIHQMAICIGSALALAVTAGWATSGAVINPWRCLIPSLLTWQAWPQTGLYLLAQLTATLTAFFLCKFLK